ncbi:MAG: DNA repair protein RecO [Firmicutes bacterium]|nr:DNA repair protein RecO [Bacillota bacterium]
MIEKVEGIILSISDYQESSRILQVLTREHGLIGVIAKGCKSVKSPLRAACNSYTYGYFYIYYKENKLSLLSNVDIINSYSNIRLDIELISYMAYLCDLTYQVVKQNDDSNIFDILINALDKINNKLNPLIITNIVELKYLDYLGISLNLDSCVKCGNKEDIVTIDGDDGGFICKNCYTNQVIVDKKTIKLIRMYYLVDIKTISTIKISDVVSREINNFINTYYDRYTGLFLKSKEFLNKLIN